MKRIYLDNAATAFPKAPGLGKVMSDYIENECVNINRTESPRTMDTFSWLYGLRENICRIYNYDRPECVIFTKNVTESLNWVIKGLLKKGDKVAVSGWEHNSVMRPIVQLGCDYSFFTDNTDCIDKDTKAVIVNAASNVSGRIIDLEKVAQKAKSCGCLLIVDAAQATPYTKIDMKALGIDVVCFTGHKNLLGPEGTGGFVVRFELTQIMDPLMSGGSGTMSDSLGIPTTMPEKFTCGTENLVGLRGLAYSVEYVLNNLESLRKRIWENTEYLYRKLDEIDGISIVGPCLDEPRTNVISVICDKMDIAELASELADNGIEMRVGLHCSPAGHRSEGTFPMGTLRFSPGPFTTKEELDAAVILLRRILSEN